MPKRVSEQVVAEFGLTSSVKVNFIIVERDSITLAGFRILERVEGGKFLPKRGASIYVTPDKVHNLVEGWKRLEERLGLKQEGD